MDLTEYKALPPAERYRALANLLAQLRSHQGVSIQLDVPANPDVSRAWFVSVRLKGQPDVGANREELEDALVEAALLAGAEQRKGDRDLAARKGAAKERARALLSREDRELLGLE